MDKRYIEINPPPAFDGGRFLYAFFKAIYTLYSVFSVLFYYAFA